MRRDREAYNLRQKEQRARRQGYNYETEVAKQGGVCAACGRTPKKLRLCRDHNHTTGAVRGFLCHPCNMALGLLGDDPDRILGLLKYLSSVGEYEGPIPGVDDDDG